MVTREAEKASLFYLCIRQKYKQNMDKTFKFIAIRANDETPDYILKKLQPNLVYWLYGGYEIEGDIIFKKTENKIPNDLYSRYLPPKNGTQISLNISAIVGENGSGKSTLIDFMIRIINNFAAAYIGELYINPKAEHLHYINNLYGELFYEQDDSIHCISVKGATVHWFQYLKEGDKYVKEVAPAFSVTRNKSSQIFEGTHQMDSNKYTLSHFFYTVISNYSLYAYNTCDYNKECTDLRIENRIRSKAHEPRCKRENYDDRCWIKSLFHKNDGYQTPIVLTPFRDKGNIDVNIETVLAKERLMALMLFSIDQENAGFQIINGHLKVEKWDLPITKRKYDRDYIAKNLGFRFLAHTGFDRLEKRIIELWGKYLRVDLTTFKKEQNPEVINLAFHYITYKTLKISCTYKIYNAFANRHINMRTRIKDEKLLDKLVQQLFKDRSHITQKIWQTLAFIMFDIYDDYMDNNISISDIAKKLHDFRQNIKDYYITDLVKWHMLDLLPPPILDFNMTFTDNKTNKSGIPFYMLSSGERQIAYSVSSFLYHILNIHSVHASSVERAKYQYVNAIFEEVELYFHPDMQRNFINFLIDGISQLSLSDIKGINICMVTHSPFVLSDIPPENILYLAKDATPEDNPCRKTFGANIHNLLKDSFFLNNGGMGAYAKRIISGIINSLNQVIPLNPAAINNSLSSQSFDNLNKADQIYQDIMLIDEPLIQTELLHLYYKAFPKSNMKQQRIQELQAELSRLMEEE